MTGGDRDCKRKEKGFFSLLSEQGDLQFHFVLGPTNYVAGPAFHLYDPLAPSPSLEAPGYAPRPLLN